jgi:hypothetical protein
VVQDGDEKVLVEFEETLELLRELPDAVHELQEDRTALLRGGDQTADGKAEAVGQAIPYRVT